MIYVQMLNQLMLMNEAHRREAIAQHAQQVFDRGFVAFVRMQVVQSQVAAQPQGVVEQLMRSFGLNPAGRLIEQQRDAVAGVWASMDAVYRQLQVRNQAQVTTTRGNQRGSAGFGGYASVPSAAASSSHEGYADERRRLKDVEDDHLRYVRQQEGHTDELQDYHRQYDTYVAPSPSPSYDSYSSNSYSYDPYDN